MVFVHLLQELLQKSQMKFCTILQRNKIVFGGHFIRISDVKFFKMTLKNNI